MKKLMLLLIAVFSVWATNAHALFDDESINQTQGQAQLQGQAQGQGQIANGGNSNQSQKAFGGSAKQGQAQGNFGVQKGNDTNTSTTVKGDSNDFNAYSFSAPSLSATEGVGEANLYSIFGGIGIANTEEYKVAIEMINTAYLMKKFGFFTDEEARDAGKYAYAKLVDAAEDKRVLGILWKTRGKHLLNLFGLAATEDLRHDNFKKPSGDDDIWGNAGNF